MRFLSTSEVSVPSSVSPYWLGDPVACLCIRALWMSAPYGFPPESPLPNPRVCSASLVVEPSSGTTRSPRRCNAHLATCINRLLPWRFCPLRRINSGESTSPRFSKPSTFRPQGFSPSRRVTPHLNARSCFVPVTPMGFCPSGVFPHCQSSRLVAANFPHDVYPHNGHRVDNKLS